MIREVIVDKIQFLTTNKNTFWSQVDEDDDSAISFREFLMIFRKARLGELDMESGLGKLATLSEVDVDAVGVGGAKTFFEAKVIFSEEVIYLTHDFSSCNHQIAEVSKGSKFAEEIKEEQEERKREEEVNFVTFGQCENF